MIGNYIIRMILIVIPLSFLISIIIRNIFVIRDIKQTFSCEYCNTLNPEINNGHKCISCGRVFRNISKKWDYFILFRVLHLNTKAKKVTYNYKKFTKLSRIEITICVTLITLLLVALLLTIIL